MLLLTTRAGARAAALFLVLPLPACGGESPKSQGAGGASATGGRESGDAGQAGQATAGQGGRAGQPAVGGGAGQAGTGASVEPPNGKGTANLFTELLGKTQDEVDAKVKTAVERFFGIGTGEPNTMTADTGYRCYYELPQDPTQAFIWAPDSNDVRSEGLSYGMMIAVQADLHAEFDKLWKFSKTYAQYPATGGYPAWKYYFQWQGTVDGSNASNWTVNYPQSVPAPDGDQYFAAALYLADRRWGSSGGVNYKQEADAIASALLHNTASGDGRTPIFDAGRGMVVFVPHSPSNGFTDPSYHLPAFYELFSRVGPAGDSSQWRSLAVTSRNFLVTSAHATTGLHPDYASFSGMPQTSQPGDQHDEFRYDAWRVVLNMAIDHAWFSQSDAMRGQIEKYHAFFSDKLTTGNVTTSLFKVDGSSPSGGGSSALTGTLAAGSLASTADNRATFVQNLWQVGQQAGLYRYYQEGVYLLALLAVSGNYDYEW
jgi:oligosaccharide reducing-end xylanase